MKVSDFVADFLSRLSPTKMRVYAICGAGAMHLNDSICHHPGIEVIPMQHEQAATFAAEAEARVTNDIAVVHVTAGPGGTNTITGVACAYVDSIPLLVIAGQVTSSTMIGHTQLRQGGMNELDMVSLMQPITKYARTLTEPFMIRYCLEKALYSATTGRKGPAFLEIPLDLQAAEVDPAQLTGFYPRELEYGNNQEYLADKIERCYALFEEAKRPVIIFGNGVRLANACDELKVAVARLQTPVVSSWTASDIIPNQWPLHIGRCGIFGDRAANYAVQNSDLILAIGTRLSVAQIGHHPSLFAPKAKKIVVDIDSEEAIKSTINADLSIVADAKDFLTAWKPGTHKPYDWRDECAERRHSAFEGLEKARGSGSGINAYDFVDELGRCMDDDAIVVTDVGFSFIPTMQRLRLSGRQRLIHSCGVSPMGWGLPASIGACLSGEGRQTICLTGDGGLMLNIQELYTIAQRQLPIAIFVFCNDGYATMRIAQNTHFKRESIAGENSGNPIPFEMLRDVAYGFGLRTFTFSEDIGDLAGDLKQVLGTAENEPVLAVLNLSQDQLIAPRLQARMEGGKFVPTTLEDQWPFIESKADA